jgi:hypothetical protein
MTPENKALRSMGFSQKAIRSSVFILSACYSCDLPAKHSTLLNHKGRRLLNSFNHQEAQKYIK